MTARILTTEETQALRDTAQTGPLVAQRCCAYQTHAGRWSVRRADGTLVAEVAGLSGNRAEAVARLLAAAPDLAATVVSVAAERDRWATQARCDARDDGAAIDKVAAELDAERAEVARLRRMIEHAAPWQVSEEPTDEEMQALRLRWAFGPERYQGDADALISAVIHARRDRAALRDQLQHARTRAADAAETERVAEERRGKVLELMGERDALRAIIEGRTTPPTDAEAAAHHAAGGSWDVVVTVEGRHFPMTVSVQGMVRDTRDGIVVRRGETKRWRPRDAARDICVWPVVAEVTP